MLNFLEYLRTDVSDPYCIRYLTALIRLRVTLKKLLEMRAGKTSGDPSVR